MSNKFDNFNLPANAYASFDAVSLRDLIIQRLNTNSVFTDQNFQGSNISSIIDIIAYSYHVLLFYLNQTSSESNFSSSSLYENITKIVSILNYKPVGNQTAVLSFNASADISLPSGIYSIPRYSYFTINGIGYSFNNDITFTVPVTGGTVSNLQNETTLFQGTYKEYPIYTAQGAPFETTNIVLVDPSGNNIAIDHFNIDVYVKNNTLINPVWEKWEPSVSLFLEKPNTKKYEIRLNENQRYEIKFGNNITGAQLNVGDSVAIYYLQTDKEKGEIGANILNGAQLFFYNTTQYNNIITDTASLNNQLIPSNANLITFSNIYASTKFTPVESVDNIKQNAINTFQSQYRLLTTTDVKNFIAQNFGSIISSITTVNNFDYIAGHLNYLFNLGIETPTDDSRILLNQVKFATPCHFNNIYVYAVPKINTVTSLTTRTNFLNPAQKQYILNSTSPYKILTSDIIINDPIYMAVDLGVLNLNEDLIPDISNDTFLQITVDVNSINNKNSIQQMVNQIFTDYFNTTDDNLGLLIDINSLTSQILNINNVVGIHTVRNSVVKNGISLLVYNPVYPDKDIQVLQQNFQLQYFQYPYLHNQLDFINKIKVVTA